jgi:hypothetical protein
MGKKAGGTWVSNKQLCGELAPHLGFSSLLCSGIYEDSLTQGCWEGEVFTQAAL